MLSPGDLKRGAVIEIDGAACVVENINVQTPSARGASTLWKVRARNLKTRQKVDVVYRGGDTIVEPDFERRSVQYLYQDGTHYHFMDQVTFDQFAFAAEDLEEEKNYLLENMEGLRSLLVEEEPIAIELPLAVELKIVECDPAARGNSATGRTKPAVLETGLSVQVPEHINNGDTIRVETSTGRFVSRVSKR